MPKAHKLTLVGIGYRPLDDRASGIVGSAEVILASSRLLEVFKRYDEYEAVGARITVIDKVPDIIGFIRQCFSRTPVPSVILLASGDPFFFGIGRRMIEEFGRDRVEILPDLSSMQTAFARINVPWDDAFCISVHGGPDSAKRRTLPYEMDDIPRLLLRYRKLAVLTDRQNNPAEIARRMPAGIREQPSMIVMHVCERLGYPDERIWTGAIEAAARMSFAEPNVVILHLQGADEGGQGPGEIGFGLKESELSHARGLITKDEVRAVALHKLRLPQRGVLWDIGAGSGSVSIEAARVCRSLSVFSIERDEEQAGHLRTNRATFDVRNLEIVPGTAPDALSGLPDPDRVFIGGSGGRLDAILAHIRERLRTGVVVVNAVTLDTLNKAIAGLEEAAFSVSVSEIAVSRSKDIAGKRQMTAQNPIFVVTGEKRGHAG